jgi:DNA invertase Pin-like site-specific DNA recombinase
VITAALYLRSSKDRSDVSIDAQRRALTALAEKRGLLVVREYSDTVESGKDEDRPGFQGLISDLRNRARGWSALLLLDTSRLARRRHIAMMFEHDAEKHGVSILYKSIPDDSDPITTMLTKSILQAIDEWHSLTSRQKGLAGMAENVRKGFRAGGRAPLGYRLRHINTGAVRDGADVQKSKLEPTANARTVAEYLRLRARNVPRSRAAEQTGLNGSASSLTGVEWNALTYAGHTVWNVHNEFNRDGYKGGTKRRPRAEWIMQRDTHSGLITEDEAEKILAQLETGKRQYGKVKSDFLLAGLLTAPDGEKWRGEGKNYRYRANGKKGKYVSAHEIERAVWDQVQADTGSPDFVARLVAETRRRHKKPNDETKALQKEVVAINAQIARMMELAGQMTVAAPALRKVEELEGRRQAIVADIARATREHAADAAVSGITEDQARHILADLLADATDTSKRHVLDGLVERVTLDPLTLDARIEYRIEYRRKLASPRGREVSPVLRTISSIFLRRVAS